MLGRFKCLWNGHEWNIKDVNKEIKKHSNEIGEEIFIRCSKCNKILIGFEKTTEGWLKWNSYDKETILYDINPEYMKKEGLSHNIEKFKEDNR